MALSSCSFLDYNERSFQEQDDVFVEFDRIKQTLTHAYSYLPTGYASVGDAMRSAASDDAEYVLETANIQLINNGVWSPVQPVDAQWETFYQGIRAANLFLEEGTGDNFAELQFNEEYQEIIVQYNNYAYEARLLRAFFYFELAKRYGDVPLVLETLDPVAADAVARTPFSEVMAFIVAECEVAIDSLPQTYESLPNQETGRVDKGMAMALKARALLYAASPLHNPGGETAAWVAAAEAAKAIIDSSWYSLPGSYASVVNNRGSSGLIYGRRLDETNGFERLQFPVGFEGGNTGTCPTQNLVDAYEMVDNGLPINEPASGYDPANPYAGRDPRLALTVTYNQSNWQGTAVEVWEGGKHGPPVINATPTGYYLRKYVDESINLNPTAGQVTAKEHNWCLFRYAEVLLNYAEAMNEAYGPDDPASYGLTARDAVNAVRQRAGMPDFPAGLSQAAFREKLRTERRVELAFEDHRFWDLRRWQIGAQTTEIRGMKVTQLPGSSFSYQPFVLENREWDERMNLYPLPQAELFLNQQLSQNPGW